MIGFISDIHGNLPALQAVFDALDEKGVGSVYSLGDVAGYYPMVNECAALLKERSVPNILGNHDNYLVNNVRCRRSPLVRRAIRYQKSVITPDNLDWLKKSARSFDTPFFFAVHGGLGDFLEEYTEAPVFPGSVKQPLFLCGHTHVQMYGEDGDKCFCNPGSVGQPRDGDPRASYAIVYDSGLAELCRAEYDIDRIVAETKRAGLEERYCEGLRTGSPIAPSRRR